MQRNALFRWAVGKGEGVPAFARLAAYEDFAKRADQKPTTADLEAIQTLNLPREALPTAWLNEQDVWGALLPSMPLWALTRNLGNMTKLGVIDAFGTGAGNRIVARLKDADEIRRSRMHPYHFLVAQVTYAQGHGMKAKGEWTPVPAIVDALNDAFVLAHQNVTPTGKNVLVAIDGSGSMQSGRVVGNDYLSVAQAAAALAYTFVQTDTSVVTVGFTQRLIPFSITKRDTIASVAQKAYVAPEATDCALPFHWAIHRQTENPKAESVDAFVVITDNETWSGREHPQQALKRYREQYNPKAKLVVIAMSATRATIGDPNDPNILDVVGFDASAPAIIGQFIRGEL